MNDPRLKRVHPGQPVSADTMNGLIDANARQAIQAPDVVQTPAGSVIIRRRASGEAPSVASVSFAMIGSRAGVAPPFRYSASEATMDIDGVWSIVPGGFAYNNVFNLEEQGIGGQWVNPINNGDVVVIYSAPDPSVDAFICQRSHYRGTY